MSSLTCVLTEVRANRSWRFVAICTHQCFLGNRVLSRKFRSTERDIGESVRETVFTGWNCCRFVIGYSTTNFSTRVIYLGATLQRIILLEVCLSLNFLLKSFNSNRLWNLSRERQRDSNEISRDKTWRFQPSCKAKTFPPFSQVFKYLRLALFLPLLWFVKQKLYVIFYEILFLWYDFQTKIGERASILLESLEWFKSRIFGYARIFVLVFSLYFSQISFLLISYLLFPLRLRPLIISTNHASQIVFFITPNLLGSHFVCSFSILVLFSSFMISNAEIIINFIRFCSRRLTFKLLKIESFFEKFSFSLGTEKSSRSFPRRRRG